MTADKLYQVLEQYFQHKKIEVFDLRKDTWMNGDEVVVFGIPGCVEIPFGILPLETEWYLIVESYYDSTVDRVSIYVIFTKDNTED